MARRACEELVVGRQHGRSHVIDVSLDHLSAADTSPRNQDYKRRFSVALILDGGAVRIGPAINPENNRSSRRRLG